MRDWKQEKMQEKEELAFLPSFSHMNRSWIELKPDTNYHGLKVVDADTVEIVTGYFPGSRYNMGFFDKEKLTKNKINTLRPAQVNEAQPIRWRPTETHLKNSKISSGQDLTPLEQALINLEEKIDEFNKKLDQIAKMPVDNGEIHFRREHIT